MTLHVSQLSNINVVVSLVHCVLHPEIAPIVDGVSCVVTIKHECGSSIVFASRKLLGAMYMTFHVLQLSHGSVVGGSTL